MSAPVSECPICMDTIEGLCNRVVTECGHAFHCSCLMQNAAHNGFGCPYCRTKMAEEPEQEESDDGYDDEEEVTVFESDALTSFRMFHQRINGEEVEEEEAEEWATVDGDEEEEDEEEEEAEQFPDAAYMAQKLTERGITLEDLVKDILYQEHSHFGTNYTDYERRSSEVYGQFRAIITQYRPNSQVTPSPSTAAPSILPNPSQIQMFGRLVPPPSQVSNPVAAQTQPPKIADAKPSASIHRRECL